MYSNATDIVRMSFKCCHTIQCIVVEYSDLKHNYYLHGYKMSTTQLIPAYHQTHWPPNFFLEQTWQHAQVSHKPRKENIINLFQKAEYEI